jgi:hypothetical protein
MMGFSLGSLLGGGLGFLVGGPAGATIGAGLGTAASGGSVKDDLMAAGLGYLGGTYGPGLMGAEAGAGTGANLASMGGAQGLMAGGAPALDYMGGGTGLTYSGLGAGLGTDLGVGLGGLGTGLGAVDYGLTSGLGTAGLGSSLGGMGPVDYSLGGATGVGGGGGGIMDMLRQRMGAMGLDKSTLGTIGGGLNIFSGLYGLNAAQQMQAMARNADPMAAYRPGYAAQLAQLTSNPSMITSMPGYKAGLQAVERSMAAQGYQGSGNMMAALQKYGGDFYNQQVNQLASLGGANISPSVAMQGMGMGNLLAGQSLASLGYGTRMLGV